MLYDYNCECGNTQEAVRKMDNRFNAPDCDECGKETTLGISLCGGFKITGGGVHSPGFSARTGKGRYKFDEPVGPLDKRSKAYQKKMDDESSKHYGPGQSASMNSKEFKEFSTRRDQLDKGQTNFR